MRSKKRIEVVRAMETLARCINNREIFMRWSLVGVADGDITPKTTDGDLEYYIDDDTFAELMGTFLRRMAQARKNGGLYCDGIVSREV